MKKILMILICGFAFTQSIQTKQVSVTIEQWDTPINLFTEMGLIGDRYEVSFVDVDIENGSTVCDDLQTNYYYGLGFPINLIDDYKMSINEEFGMCHINVSIDYDCANQYASDNRGWNIPTSGLFITQMGQNIYLSQYYDAMICGQVDYSILGNMTLTFWVTGLFEDELMPDVGDMNLDGNINVVDVVVLVNSILGIG